MLTRIDRNSIICDDIKTSTGEKYITSDAVFNAQALAETAAVNAIEAANDAQITADTIRNETNKLIDAASSTINEVVSEIKQETFNAQALAETAALEAIDAKSKSVEIKNEFDVYRNNGCVYSGDIILNGSKLLLANGASVELFTGEELPTPGGSGGESYPLPEEPIDTSDFATLSGDNEFTGNNNFTGTIQTDSITIGDNILSSENGNLMWNGVSIENQDLSDYVTTSELNSKGYLTSSSLSDYAKKSDLSSYATTSSLSSYLKSSDIKGYISSTTKSTNDWYIKYSNGLILQGGTLSITSNLTTVTFPTPFSSIPSIYLSRATTRGQGSWDSELYPYSISKSNFSYKMNTTEVSNATWFAIGY